MSDRQEGAERFPLIRWADEFGTAHSAAICPLPNGEVRFDMDVLVGPDVESKCMNLTRRAAAEVAQRLRDVLNAMTHV